MTKAVKDEVFMQSPVGAFKLLSPLIFFGRESLSIIIEATERHE
jgi:hypothetical protein